MGIQGMHLEALHPIMELRCENVQPWSHLFGVVDVLVENYQSLQGFQQQVSVSSSPMTLGASALAGSRADVETTDGQSFITPEGRCLWDTPAFAKGSIPETPPPPAVCL